ncbi:MCE family protein [Pseudonocardia acidicola]|uniref:MCE family protein n=1 Tax=Pseudonocardia acidicola TaxID=2724939 RepID=A0ABX1S9P6_9PSEU|nr:MCE family protein [Pseudonocardia acidicola]
MNSSGLWGRTKYKIYALVLIAAFVGLAAVSVVAYNKGFTRSIPVTLQADRAGLQMRPGNIVKIRGVDLGRVEKVVPDPDGSGVSIVMDLDPELAKVVPVNAVASLEQLTAFGNKAVQLSYPPNPSSETLKAGSVITANHVTTEVNDLFDKLTHVLNVAQPAKLNTVLGAFAETLDGNGDRLGASLSKANDYLGKINGDLPQLQRDWQATAGFANVYADAAPDIVAFLSNLGVTSQTLADRTTDVPGLLHGLQNIGNEGDVFFGENAEPLTTMLASLRPTTSLLKEYSPALTCFLQGAAVSWDKVSRVGFNETGAMFTATLALGANTYQYPRDLPRVGPGAMKGPDCHGLPNVGQQDLTKLDETPDPPNHFSPTNTPQPSDPPVLVQMFGPDALLPGATGNQGKQTPGQTGGR